MSTIADTLDDLTLLVTRVEASVQGRTYEQLIANDEAYDALTYRLAMVGATAKKLSEELKARHPLVPWREMATFRNFASHDYFGIDGNLVWRAAHELDAVRVMIREELSRLGL